MHLGAVGARSSKIAKQDFVTSAWKLGCAGGYEAVKIRAVAEHAGVSGALIYSYYEDKAALMDALRAMGADLLDVRLDEEMQRAEPAELLRLTRRYIAFMREHAWLYRGESKVDLNGPDAQHAQALIRRAASLLELGTAELGDQPEPGVSAALHLWLSLRGVVLIPLASLTFTQAFVDAHAALCVRGVTASSRDL